MSNKNRKSARSLTVKLTNNRKSKIAYYIQKGQFSKAATLFNLLKDKASDNPSALLEHLVSILEKIPANCTYTQGFIERLLEQKEFFLFETGKICETHHCNIGFLFGYGEHLMEKGSYKAAAKVFEQVLKIHPECTTALRIHGFALFKLGEYVSAVERYEQVLEKLPENVADIGVLYNYSKALQQLGQYEKAFEIYEQSLQIAPDDLRTLIGYGADLSNLGYYKEATEKFEHVLSIDPHEILTLTNYGITLTKLEQYNHAFKKFNQALIFAPDDSDILYYYGYALAQSGQHEKAVQQYKKALELAPQNRNLLNDYAESLDEIGQYETIVNLYEQVLQKIPDDIELLNNYGLALCKSGKLSQGAKQFKQVLQADPSNIRALADYGTALQGIGQIEAAIEIFERVLQIQPTHVMALNNYGLTLYRAGKYELSVKQYQKALEINASDKQILANYGDALIALGLYKAAIEAFQLVLQMELNDEDWLLSVLNNYGVSLFYTGEYQKAIEQFEHALRIVPESQFLLKNYNIAIQKKQLETHAFKILSRKPSHMQYGKLEASNFQMDSQNEEKFNHYKKPIVYVEGPTDVIILNTAWQKLHGETVPLPFLVRNSDLLPETFKEGGAGGTNSLIARINGVGHESISLVIGLLDYDDAGLGCWNKKVPKNLFKEIPEINARVSLHGKAAITLLPIPDHRKEYARRQNLCIEYFFDDSVLSKKTTDGKGLSFSFPEVRFQFGDVKGKQAIEDEAARKVGGDKRAFAEKIVPSLSGDEFKVFQLIFDRLEKIIYHLQSLEAN